MRRPRAWALDVWRTQDRRHPAAQAFDRFRASEQGKSCFDFATLAPGPYLANRLRAAFEAGWSECENLQKRGKR